MAYMCRYFGECDACGYCRKYSCDDIDENEDGKDEEYDQNRFQ